MTAPSISLTQNVVRVGMAELLDGGKVSQQSMFSFIVFRWPFIAMLALDALELWLPASSWLALECPPMKRFKLFGQRGQDLCKLALN